MTHRNKTNGVFTSAGRAADESLEIAEAIRAGRLTRRQLKEWYARRRREGMTVAELLREKTSEMVGDPLERAIARGEELFRSAAAGAMPSRSTATRSSPKRAVRRRRRTTGQAAGRRAARKSDAR